MDENKIELIDESVQAEEAYQEIRGYLIEAQNRAKQPLTLRWLKHIGEPERKSMKFVAITHERHTVKDC